MESGGEAAAKEVEDVGGLADWRTFSADLAELEGRWKLIYSKAFRSCTVGSGRPGPSTGRLLPVTFGQVFQRSDVLCKDFENVDVELDALWPLPPARLPTNSNSSVCHCFNSYLNSTNAFPSLESPTYKQNPFPDQPSNLSFIRSAKIKITFKKTLVLITTPLEMPRSLDSLRPSSIGSGEFKVAYLDSDM